MIKLIFLFLVLSKGDSTVNPIVDGKFTQVFEASFPNAIDVSWSIEGDGAWVYFEEGGIKCRMLYTQESKVSKFIRWYKGDRLNPFIKAKIYEKYKGKSIFGVTELIADDEAEYAIVLEDKQYFYYIQVTPTGRMSMNQKLRKQNPPGK